MSLNTYADKNNIDAGGAVVFRQQTDTLWVCLVHRPWYDDWSFPKGKQEKDESIVRTAVREVGEETGIPIRLGAKIGTITYPLPPQAPQGRHTTSPSSGITFTKRVAYWIGHPISETAHLQRSEALGVPLIRDHETDNIVWVDCQEAAARLTYDDDRMVLTRFQELARARATDAATVLLTLQAKAEPSGRWNTAFDQQRPLTPVGAAEAFRTTRDLASYGVTRLETVPYTRCTETLQPYFAQTGTPILSDILPSDATTSVSDAYRTLDDALADAATRPQSPTAICLRRTDFDNFLRGTFPRFRSPQQGSPEESKDTVSPCKSLGIKPGMCLALTIVPEPWRKTLPCPGYRILTSHVVTEHCSES
ncbi:MAG: NUDIX domain-containing protein [Bifidobacteriaceae bacterium]|nr:NUDIX domain-containing protein [Bifidobacteriaceae bacterium]